MNKSRHGSLVVVPNLDYVSSVEIASLAVETRDRQKFLDVGFLVGRVLTLVFCLLVWAIFLSLRQFQRLDHHPQTLKKRSGEITGITQLTQMVSKLQ